MTLAAVASRKCYGLWYSKHTEYLVFLNSLTTKNHTEYAKKRNKWLQKKNYSIKGLRHFMKNVYRFNIFPFCIFFHVFPCCKYCFFFQPMLKRIFFQMEQKNLIYLWIFFTGSIIDIFCFINICLLKKIKNSVNMTGNFHLRYQYKNIYFEEKYYFFTKFLFFNTQILLLYG